MPMGVTSKIYDGTDMDVHHYMESVARSLTDFIHMPDESYNKRLTKRNLASPSRKEAAEAALKGFVNKSEDEQYAEWVDDTTRTKQAYADVVRKNEELAARYDEMIAKVEGLDFPEGLEYAREHALKYLRESKDFDCYEPTPEFYETYTFDVWRTQRMEELTKDVAYYTKSYEEDVARDAEFNEKIDLWSRVVGYDIV